MYYFLWPTQSLLEIGQVLLLLIHKLTQVSCLMSLRNEKVLKLGLECKSSLFQPRHTGHNIFLNFFYRLVYLFLFSHGPTKKHIKFNSPSSQGNVLRIIKSELAFDSLYCHVSFWALFAPEHVFPTTADPWELLSCLWAAPSLGSVGPTWVAGGQREVRESKALNVHLSFPNIYGCAILWGDIYRCGILWGGIL